MQIDPERRHLSLQAQAEETFPGKRAASLRAEAEAIMSRLSLTLRSTTGPRSVRFTKAVREKQQRAGKLRARAAVVIAEAYAAVLNEAQVIVCTCSGAAGRDLAERKFRVVIVDEATQATEPSTLVPLMKGVECFVLAGDPMQLPPTVKTREAELQGLGRCVSQYVLLAGIAVASSPSLVSLLSSISSSVQDSF
jgi:superfamily I DNA and/or RNA helicase